MWNELGKSLVVFPTVALIDAVCSHESFYIVHLIFPYFEFFFQLYYCIYSLYGNNFDLLFMLLFIMSAPE